MGKPEKRYVVDGAITEHMELPFQEIEVKQNLKNCVWGWGGNQSEQKRKQGKSTASLSPQAQTLNTLMPQ